MLGCKYGLAILEDRSGEELNPNVALEYGFMSALGRKAILVKEKTFKYIRADLVGTLVEEYSVGSDLAVDEESLRTAIEKWMISLDQRARRART